MGDAVVLRLRLMAVVDPDWHAARSRPPLRSGMRCFVIFLRACRDCGDARWLPAIKANIAVSGWELPQGKEMGCVEMAKYVPKLNR